MNLDRIRKAIGERVQLRPPAIPLDEVGAGLPSADDAWLIDSVSDDDVRITNARTGHFTHLGKDHIHHYTTNPDETRRTGVPHGFFVLNVQVYLQGPRLRVTPCAKPGEPVLPSVPAISELEVDLSYPADSGLQAQLAAAGFRIAWARESRVARLTNLEGWSPVVVRSLTGLPIAYRLRDRPEDQLLLMRAEDAA